MNRCVSRNGPNSYRNIGLMSIKFETLPNGPNPVVMCCTQAPKINDDVKNHNLRATLGEARLARLKFHQGNEASFITTCQQNTC